MECVPLSENLMSPDLMQNPTPSGTKQTSHLLSCISVNIHSQTQFTLGNCKNSISTVVKSESQVVSAPEHHGDGLGLKFHAF
jgi:hypothetical protein